MAIYYFPFLHRRETLEQDTSGIQGEGRIAQLFENSLHDPHFVDCDLLVVVVLALPCLASASSSITPQSTAQYGTAQPTKL